MPSVARAFRTTLLVASTLLLPGCAGQRADSAYSPRVTATFSPNAGPVVCVDGAHNNSHTIDGLYEPFAKLLSADGYRVRAADDRLEHGVPRECAVYVIVNAAGGKTYKLFGLNLPTRSRERRHLSAFGPAEIDSVARWVERGGALLLVADHYPYGSAASALGRMFGVEMSGGFTEAANRAPGSRDRGELLYSRENGLLAEHAITAGRIPSERVARVVTFTGQSLHATVGIPLLVLGDSAVDFVPSPPTFTPKNAAGRAQGLVIERGRGRVVVLGEAAALTAQIDDRGRPFGMQVPGNDNAQFALNILHWLARAL